MLCTMKESSRKKGGIALLVVAILLVLYVGSYYLLIEKAVPTAVVLGSDPHVLYRPRYRIGGDLAHSFFAPIHWIDKVIRQDAWTFRAKDLFKK